LNKNRKENILGSSGNRGWTDETLAVSGSSIIPVVLLLSFLHLRRAGLERLRVSGSLPALGLLLGIYESLSAERSKHTQGENKEFGEFTAASPPSSRGFAPASLPSLQ